MLNRLTHTFEELGEFGVGRAVLHSEAQECGQKKESPQQVTGNCHIQYDNSIYYANTQIEN